MPALPVAAPMVGWGGRGQGEGWVGEGEAHGEACGWVCEGGAQGRGGGGEGGVRGTCGVGGQ